MEPLVHMPNEGSPWLGKKSQHDVVQLAIKHEWNELHQVPVCIDKHGIIRSYLAKTVGTVKPICSR